MKTTALTLLMVLCITVMAKNQSFDKPAKIYEDKCLTRTLEKTMKNPSEIQIDDNSYVIATFILDENGNISIKEVKSVNQQLADYVSARLETFRPEILEEGTLGRELTYKFLFKV
ncbi:MAG: hypothetical protein JXR58_07490 [Bacteroidales bacterium]|nr:hypothetical protein [Bacteroidales bacterium]